MPRMRSIDQAYDYLVERDKKCALTKTALRRLVVSGKLPCVKVGIKYLINLDTLDEFLTGAPSQDEPCGGYGVIRRIDYE